MLLVNLILVSLISFSGCEPLRRKRNLEVASETTKRPACTKEEVAVIKWKEDCNACFCAGEGMPACTLMGCMKPAGTPVLITNLTKVKRDTKIPACTKEEVGVVSWKDDCNTCSCVGEGRIGCTIMGCGNSEAPVTVTDSKRVKRDTKRSTCTKEEVGIIQWKEECNSCFCADEGVPACTLMGCVKAPKPPAAGADIKKMKLD